MQEQLNKVLEIYKNFPDEDKFIFLDLLEDILNYDFKNLRKPSYMPIQTYKIKKYFDRIRILLKNFTENYKIDEKELSKFYKEEIDKMFVNGFIKKENGFDSFCISKIVTHKERKFTLDLKNQINKENLSLDSVGDKKIDALKFILEEHGIVEIWDRKNFTSEYKKELDVDLLNTKKILNDDNILYNEYIVRFEKDSKEIFGENIFDDYEKNADKIDKIMHVVIHKKGVINNLIKMIKESEINLFFDSESGILYNFGKPIHTFDIGHPRYLFMNCVFNDVKDIGKSITYSKVCRVLDRNYMGGTLTIKQDKQIRNLIDALNKLIKEKTGNKIEKTFFPTKDGKPRQFMRIC